MLGRSMSLVFGHMITRQFRNIAFFTSIKAGAVHQNVPECPIDSDFELETDLIITGNMKLT
jgi:hypothetical protein